MISPVRMREVTVHGASRASTTRCLRNVVESNIRLANRDYKITDADLRKVGFSKLQRIQLEDFSEIQDDVLQDILEA